MQAKLSWAIAIGWAFVMVGMPAWSGPARGSATLSWYPPTTRADGTALTNLAGYRIYYGRSAKALNRSIRVNNPGLTRYVVERLPPARWHFAMTSVNAQGAESARSKTVSKTIL